MLGAVFLLSGAAGLMHEVVWARLLGHIFGVSSLAISTVLAAYMGGLALGSYWIGTRSGRLRDGRRAYALFELGIGLFALSMPLLFRVTQPFYGAIWRQLHLSFAALSAVRFVITGGLLIGPTFLMGATLPALTHYMGSLRGHRLPPQWLYTLNVAGGVLGVALAGFVLMPVLGLRGTIAAAAGLNIGGGLLALRLPALATRTPTPETIAPENPRLRDPLLLAAAFFSGATSLATQVAWTRVLILVVGSTAYAFSTVLLVYLVALAAGSAWAARRQRRAADVTSGLATSHAIMAAALVAAIYFADYAPAWYLSLFERWRPQTITASILLNTVTVGAILFLPVLFAGTILPLVMIGALPVDAGGDAPAVGIVYALNTAGAIIGAILAGFILVPFLGSQNTLLAVVVVAAILAPAFALRSTNRAVRWSVPTLAAAAILAGLLQPRWHQASLNAGVFEPGMTGTTKPGTTGPILYHAEGQTATVVVTEQAGQRAIRINGRFNASDGSRDMPTQVLQVQVPLLLQPSADDIFIVGWGSGITAGAALQSPAKRVTAVELEPAVVEASRFFLHANHDPLRDPRMRLYLDDARHILLASTDEYDTIVSEPSHPWIAGVANVFTRDFFEIAARRLRDDGLFVQWLQGYQISLDTFSTILATFQSVFPQVVLYSPSDSADWLLLGSQHPLQFDLDEIDRRLSDPAMRTENARVGVRTAEDVLAGVYLGPEQVRAVTHGIPLNTDDNMLVEFTAPKSMLRNTEETSEEIALFFLSHATPLEEMVRDRAGLLSNRDRLRRLVAGVERQGLPTDRYARLLAEAEAAR